MKRLILIMTFLSVTVWGFAQKQVIPVSQKNSVPLGQHTFHYVLPMTAFEITVTVTKSKDMAGYYSDYAERLLGLTNIITANKTTYKIKEISICAITLPDQNHQYIAELSSTQIKQGFLSKMTSDLISFDTPTTSPYLVSSLPIPDFYKNFADLAYIEMDDSFLETKIIDGVVTQVPVNKTKNISKTTEQQAKEAADLILKIRSARYDLLTGVQEVPYSKEAIEYMVEQLNQYEKNYLGLFTGFSVTEEAQYTFVVTPKTDGLTPAFSFDAENGIGEASSVKNEKNYYLKISPLANITTTIKEETDEMGKKKPVEGYRFRKPMPAKVSLCENEKEVHLFGQFTLYQLGELITLPAGNDQFEIGKFVGED